MGCNIGIDLGTTNTLLYMRGRGIVLREPTVVAIQTKTKRVIAAGKAARQMLGKTPGSLSAKRPVQEGVITDFDVTSEMLRIYFQKIGSLTLFNRPRVVVCVPHGVTEVEKRAVHEVARNGGAIAVSIVEEPVAAAVGSGLRVNEPRGTMLVDIGGGTVEVAVLSMNGIVQSNTLKKAGIEMDKAIMEYIKRNRGVLIGENTAELLKCRIGSVHPNTDQGRTLDVPARNIDKGLPITIRISSAEIRRAISPIVEQIITAVHTTLENTPPELATDIYNRGIMLTGGGSKIPGIGMLISQETGLRAVFAKEPLDSVANGLGMMIENAPESWTDIFSFLRR